MKKIRVEKRFNGAIDLRDYLVKEAIDKDRQVCVEYNGEVMFLSVEDLRHGKKNGLRLVSKWGNKIYDLVSFPWKPDKNKQMKLC